MAAVIVQIQGIKDISENHKTNGVKLHMYLSSSITFSEWESKTKVLSKSIVYHAICYKKNQLHLSNSPLSTYMFFIYQIYMYMYLLHHGSIFCF